MRIAITGAAGFVGRTLVHTLLDAGHETVAIDIDTAALGERETLKRVNGDMADARVRDAAFDGGIDAMIHLATVPGGAAEADPVASRRINIDAMYDMIEAAAAAASSPPRIVYASSIAVLGDPLSPGGVDDDTPITPRLVYGIHKAMMEIALAGLSRRDVIDGVTVRLPGILARPKGPSGMKSAFMSDLFHALRAGERFCCPVSPTATIWAQSITRCVDNFVQALTLDADLLPPTRAVTLPAQRIAMADLAIEIARQCGTEPGLVSYEPDPALEAAFGSHPTLDTPAAERCGFAHDGSLSVLVERALTHLAA